MKTSDTTTIYRVQDKEGRGPFRPGFSHKWSNQDKTLEDFPPWVSEFGFGILKKAIVGQSVGSGCRDITALRRWFADNELSKLYAFGYSVVEIKVDRILAESKCQLVFCRNLPLHENVKPLPLHEVLG